VLLPAIPALISLFPERNEMKKAIFLVAGCFAVCAVGVALAGAEADPSCCPQMQVVQKGCHGATLHMPAAIEPTRCHGRRASRITLGERVSYRSMARQNFRATLQAGRSAARVGDGVAPIDVEVPATTLVPKCNCEK